MTRFLIFILLAICCQQQMFAVPMQTKHTIKEQMEIIKKEHSVKFVYDASLKLDIPYSGKPLHGLTLEQNLKELFHGTGIAWEIKGKYVLLTRAKQKSKAKYTLSGYVYDKDGETIINATVWDAASGIGTLTNEHGFFSLTLPEGRHRVHFSCVGMGERLEEVLLNGNKPMNIYLNDSYQLEEVVVTADLNSPNLTTQTGKKSLTSRDLQTEFALFSSPDVVKTLQNLSGVAAGTELISGLYVHGGGNDENLFLLDGTPLYQVNHLGGLFSAFNTDVVKNIDFYKSGFPARYGGRLSSVVDVRTNEGNMREYHGSVTVGLLDGRIQFEGPIRKDRTSFNIAMRRTWLDLFTVPALAIRNQSKRDDKINVRYAFHDINAKITHRFSDRSQADISFYSGNDVFKVKNILYPLDRETDTDKFDLQWGNLTAALNWKYRFSSKLFANLTGVYTRNISHSDYLTEEKVMDEGTLTGITHTERRNHSTIDDVGYRMEFDYRPGTRHHLRMGSNYLLHFFRPQSTTNYDYSGDEQQQDTISRQASCFYRGHELSLYAEDDIALTHRLQMNAGVHYTLFCISGKVFHSVEPRAALRYQFSGGLTVKASYTEMSQFMHQLSNTYLNLPTDYWVSSTRNIRPMRSRQYAAGIYMRLPFRVQLNVEGFYKTMHHAIEYDGGNRLTPSADNWESLIRFGKGKSYGMEMEASYSGRRISANAAYTLSWSKRNFPEFHAGWYADKFDNRHKLNFAMRYKASSRIETYASWCYHSGNRMTVPQQIVDAPILPGIESKGETEWVYEQPNNVSLPAYHRLDVGANFRKTTKRGDERIWNVSIYNAYCRMNALYGKVVQRPDGSFRGKATGVFPIMPSFSYTLKF